MQSITDQQKQEVHDLCRFSKFTTKKAISNYYVIINKELHIDCSTSITVEFDAFHTLHNVAQIKWNKKMNRWTYPQWAWFIAILLKKLAYKKGGLTVTYKLFQRFDAKFHITLQTHLDDIISSTREFASFYIQTPCILPDRSLHADMALRFDTFTSINPLLCRMNYTAIEDRTSCPAMAYHIGDNDWIMDCKNMLHKGHRSYIEHRLASSTRDKRITKFICKYVEALKPKNELIDCQELWEYSVKLKEHETRIIPKRMRKLFDKYQIKCEREYRRKCQVCNKVERSKYGDNENGKMFVHKIYVCKCKELFVCSNKCHKYAWKRHNHRLCCKARKEK
eukprot:171052_1